MKSLPMLVALAALAFACLAPITPEAHARQRPRPNILFITVDDMSTDSVGVYGCGIKGLTPHMDSLAKQGLRFNFAHVQVGNCKPSRNVMWSGLYPHNNGVVGFFNVKNDWPHAVDLFKKGGYFTAIRGKATHTTPYHPYAWDANLDGSDEGKKYSIKDVASYGTSVAKGIASAKAAGKPFFINVNISDPHKPFYRGPKDPFQPTRVIKANEVPIPGFLFDHPIVRQELALYYSSVRRADDAVGAILEALDDAGQAENTVVMFLSDHGMPLPFAKTQLWHHSTRTPWMVRWPGVVKPNTVDNKHMISGVDTLSTLLEIAGIDKPKRQDGRSFAPLLHGKTQEGRDKVFKEYNENAGGGQHPMRAVQTRQYLYLYNPWSNGSRKFKTATFGTQTYRLMNKLAPENKAIAARLDLINHRVTEELYDVVADPDCLNNLVGKKKHADVLAQMRGDMATWMKDTGDPLAAVFAKLGGKDASAASEAYMAKVEAQSAERRKKKRTNQRDNKNAGKKTGKQAGKNAGPKKSAK